MPRNLRVNEVTRDSVSLTWDRSANDGGSPIEAYVVEKRDAARNNWIAVTKTSPEATRATVTKLWEGCDYLFRVAAENSVGLSDYVELERSVSAKAPFCKSSQISLFSLAYSSIRPICPCYVRLKLVSEL
jgi:Fibronectin type III domain